MEGRGRAPGTCQDTGPRLEPGTSRICNRHVPIQPRRSVRNTLNVVCVATFIQVHGMLCAASNGRPDIRSGLETTTFGI
jgi:hypothetical protein